MRILRLCTVLLVFATAIAYALPAYEITDLGYGAAWGINNSGLIVGQAYDSSGTLQAAFWQGVSPVLLDRMGQGSSLARSVNDEGKIVGWGYDTVGRQRAVQWSGGAPSLLEYGTSRSGEAAHINDSGQIVGSQDAIPTVWGVDQAARLNVQEPTYANGRAYSINDHGVICGNLMNVWGSTDYQAAIWRNGEVVSLDDLGSSWSIARDINNQGVVVGSYGVAGYERACVWQNGILLDISTSIPSKSSIAFAVNDSGQVVGSYLDDSSIPHGYVWSQGEWIALGALGGQVAYVSGVNELGQIVGQAKDADGRWHAVLWSPITPEPGSLTALLGGFIGTATIFFRRRR